MFNVFLTFKFGIVKYNSYISKVIRNEYDKF